MRFSYEDLLSGEPIFVEGIGYFRSPRLKELGSSGIGFSAYNIYIAILSWDKEEFLKNLPHNHSAIFSKNESLTLFDMMAILKLDFRELLREALSFFMVEDVGWSETESCFVTSSDSKEIGKIDRDNFDKVRSMILQLNFLDLEDNAQPKFANAKAKKYWELEQKFKKEQGKKTSGNKWMRLGNMISKLCASHSGYTFANIYDLTVYQLHDQFFQLSHLRSCAVGENAYATHGGDKFDFQNWLKPVPELLK